MCQCPFFPEQPEEVTPGWIYFEHSPTFYQAASFLNHMWNIFSLEDYWKLNVAEVELGELIANLAVGDWSVVNDFLSHWNSLATFDKTNIE